MRSSWFCSLPTRLFCWLAFVSIFVLLQQQQHATFISATLRRDFYRLYLINEKKEKGSNGQSHRRQNEKQTITKTSSAMSVHQSDLFTSDSRTTDTIPLNTQRLYRELIVPFYDNYDSILDSGVFATLSMSMYLPPSSSTTTKSPVAVVPTTSPAIPIIPTFVPSNNDGFVSRKPIYAPAGTGMNVPSTKPVSTTKPTYDASSTKPSLKPTYDSSTKPSLKPTYDASTKPSLKPTYDSSTKPTLKPTYDASTKPTLKPAYDAVSTKPSLKPTYDAASTKPSLQPDTASTNPSTSTGIPTTTKQMMMNVPTSTNSKSSNVPTIEFTGTDPPTTPKNDGGGDGDGNKTKEPQRPPKSGGGAMMTMRPIRSPSSSSSPPSKSNSVQPSSSTKSPTLLVSVIPSIVQSNGTTTVSDEPSSSPTVTNDNNQTVFQCTEVGIDVVPKPYPINMNTTIVDISVTYSIETLALLNTYVLDLERRIVGSSLVGALQCINGGPIFGTTTRTSTVNIDELVPNITTHDIGETCNTVTTRIGSFCRVLQTEFRIWINENVDSGVAEFLAYVQLQNDMGTNNTILDGIDSIIIENITYLRPLPLLPPIVVDNNTDNNNNNNSTTENTTTDNDTNNDVPSSSSNSNNNNARVSASPYTLGAVLAMCVGGFVALYAWVRNRRTRNRRHMQLIEGM